MNTKEVNLGRFSTFGIGSKGYLAEARSLEDLKEISGHLQKTGQSYFLLGGGSNVIFPDQELEPLVIKLSNQQISLNNGTLSCDSGVLMSRLVYFAAEKEVDFSPWAGIPGTVGGAIAGNAGAHRLEMSDSLIKATLFNLSSGETVVKENSWFDFAYRTSRIKQKNEGWLIWQAIFKQRSGKSSEAILQQIKDYLNLRKSAHPKHASCGSFFKNPIVTSKQGQKITQKHPPLRHFQLPGGRFKFIAAELIEQAGLKKLSYGDAEISAKHANFIVNRAQAKQQDVLSLARAVKKEVFQKYQIKLEPEVKLISSTGKLVSI
jgi:UDP-N-acetylmuramate dehydrogenase